MIEMIIKEDLVQKEECLLKQMRWKKLRKMPILNSILFITCLANGYNLACLFESMRTFSEIGNSAHIISKVA